MSSDAHQSTADSVIGVADREAMRRAMADFLRAAGLPEAAAGEAPERSTEAWIESLLSGYRDDPVALLQPTWPERSGDLVAVSGIPFVSVCAHHLLPFFGRAWVVYLPADDLTGLSRIEEMVRCLSRRLQLQEKLGEEIADALMRGAGARGAGCVLEAEHLCVFARGKRQRGTLTRSVAFSGELRDNSELQQRCLMLMGSPATGDPAAATEGES